MRIQHLRQPLRALRQRDAVQQVTLRRVLLQQVPVEAVDRARTASNRSRHHAVLTQFAEVRPELLAVGGQRLAFPRPAPGQKAPDIAAIVPHRVRGASAHRRQIAQIGIEECLRCLVRRDARHNRKHSVKVQTANAGHAKAPPSLREGAHGKGLVVRTPFTAAATSSPGTRRARTCRVHAPRRIACSRRTARPR